MIAAIWILPQDGGAAFGRCRDAVSKPQVQHTEQRHHRDEAYWVQRSA